MLFENHLKKAYSIKRGDKVLAITDTSCYTLAEETAWLAASLPENGEKEEYFKVLVGLGLKDPEKIFDRLLAIGALREKCARGAKEMIGAVLSPKIRILPAQFQAAIVSALLPARADLAGVMGALVWPALLGIISGLLFISFPRAAAPLYAAGRAVPVAVICLVIVSSLLHEFGHSLAAAACGIGLRPIGFSVYLIYPVFYTNVSGVDALRLMPKALVDCGGFILQSIFVLVLLIVFALTGSPTAGETAKWIMAIMLFNLNPLFRTDGYWLYKDVYSELKTRRWMRAAHYLYLLAFAGFSVYFLWLLGGRAGDIWNGLTNLLRLPASFFSGGYKVVLGAYFVLVGFSGGLSRFREGRQEWKELRNNAAAE